MSVAHPDRSYYPALDGLRGLAILLVVVYHNFGFIDYFFFGWLGVDLFFVLSGFLITDILLKTLNQKNYLRNFYARRILRIFPLYYLSLVIFLIIFPRLSSLNLSYYTDNQVWLWTYLQNWLYIFKDPGSSNALNHLWSLAVEEQFYLFWPLIILLIKKPAKLLVFISTLLVVVIGFRIWLWTSQIADLAYFNLYTFTRLDGICIGSMVALIYRLDRNYLKRNTWVIVLLFAAFNFIFYFVNARNDFSFPYIALIGYTTFAMIFGLLVNEAISRDTRLINYLFNTRVLKFFGKISYGFYIFHWPIYLLLNPFLHDWAAKSMGENMARFVASLLATLAALLISLLSYHFFEKYFLKLKDRFEQTSNANNKQPA